MLLYTINTEVRLLWDATVRAAGKPGMGLESLFRERGRKRSSSVCFLATCRSREVRRAARHGVCRIWGTEKCGVVELTAARSSETDGIDLYMFILFREHMLLDSSSLGGRGGGIHEAEF